MEDIDIKMAIIQKRWRVWYNDNSYGIYKWIVQRRTWYGRWKTIGSFYSDSEASAAKKSLIQEDLITFRGDLSELE
tara:strand:- start:205 stop:432 length:228 start_codon:yes stop_codon:yes gene_type:complete